MRIAIVSGMMLALGMGMMAQEAGMGGMMMEHKPGIPSTSLTVSFGATAESFTAEQLAALPHVNVSVVNGHTKKTENYSGVLLSTLLGRVGAPMSPHGKEFLYCVVAEGTDGYRVVYSLAEVSPDVHEGTVIVADTLEGKPIAANGAFQLVATGEKRPARWVRNLKAVKVVAVE